jgi:uncharacterized protein
MAEKTCDGCDSRCCKYVAIEIDAPLDSKDMENIRWYVMHKNITVYVDCEGIWHVEFLTPCEHLNSKNLCKIYERRPKICRNYDPKYCSHNNDYSEEYTFTNVEQVDKYIKEHFLK